MFEDKASENKKYENTTIEMVSRKTPQHARSLSDRLFGAFHQACDISDLEVAEQLLVILEKVLNNPFSNKKSNQPRSIESLVAAFERLWYLRHPER